MLPFNLTSVLRLRIQILDLSLEFLDPSPGVSCRQSPVAAACWAMLF